MRIWVDADACPKPVRDILFRAAERTEVTVTLVANQSVSVPRSPHVRTVQVSRGFDVADAHIVQACEPGDLVITADIPLAAEAVAKGATALNPRGELYTPENVRERLATRDMMEELRASGIQTGGPAALHPREVQAFANALDRLLARRD